MGFWARAAELVAASKSVKVAAIGPVTLFVLPANDITPAPATVRTCSRIRLTDLRHKDWTRFGVKHEGRVLSGHHADIEPKKSIRLYGHESNHVRPHDYDITFTIGSVAVYNSFNLTYTGTIVAIGEKVVKIREDHGDRVHALDIATFSDKNRGFDLEKISRRNAEWMD